MKTKNKTLDKSKFPILKPNLQISFYHRLNEIQHLFLQEALGETVKQLDLTKLNTELSVFVKPDSLAKLASFGLRGEVIYPVPCLLEARPSLIGYYRLLYGISQKEFYRNMPMSGFKRLEEHNILLKSQMPVLNDLCSNLVITGEMLIVGIDILSAQTVRDLQLLTLGAQLRGGQNTKVGKDATSEVFALFEELVHDSLTEKTLKRLVLKNATGRKVTIAFSSDPDIAITEELPSGPKGLVSIEIKGGTDRSNIHNRIGEAEKSHQKAKENGFFEFWTILGAAANLKTAKRESPTTSRFYYLPNLRNHNTAEYKHFRDNLQSIVSIKPA